MATAKLKEKKIEEGLTTEAQSHGDGHNSAVKDLGELNVGLEMIFASELNPRKHFDQKEIDELAESLKAHGQLQNATVRATAGDSEYYELIGGERRFRAAIVAGLPYLRCRLIECDDATAVELRGIENYRRAQLNAIEEAIWFEQMIGTGRYNQTSLAKYLGVTPGQVSNRLRLLQLPDEWKDQIVSGACPATHARCLASWVHRPAVLEAVARSLGLRDEEGDESISELTVGALDRVIMEEIYNMSRTMDVDEWNGPVFEITTEVMELLDVDNVKAWDGEKPRAFNVAEWDRRQKEAKERISAEREAESDDDDEQATVAQKDRSNINNHYLSRCFADYLSACVRSNLDNEGDFLRCFLAIITDAELGYEMPLIKFLETRNGSETQLPDPALHAFEFALPKKPTIKAFACFAHDFVENFLLSQSSSDCLRLLVAFSKDICSIDPLKAWKPDAGMLSQCSTEQLRVLFTDGMADRKKVSKWSKETLIEKLLEYWPAGYLPELLTPDLLKPKEEESDG